MPAASWAERIIAGELGLLGWKGADLEAIHNNMNTLAWSCGRWLPLLARYRPLRACSSLAPRQRSKSRRDSCPCYCEWPPLLSRRKRDPAKLGIAARLRRETTLPIKAIARRMHLGTSKSANIRWHVAMRASAPADRAQGRLGI